MAKSHTMSLIPKGSLVDRIKNFFGNKGSDFRIDGKNYTMREYGDLSIEDPLREKMLSCLRSDARNKPCPVYGYGMRIVIS